MVAATFPNLSFENPPGTGPTLLAGAAEPYAFVEGEILRVLLAGVQTDVVFLETDFVDIAAATAAEVGDLLELRVADLGATDDGGTLRLTSLLTGEDVSLEIDVSSTANAALSFPPGAVTGETYDGGPPNGWTVTTEVDTSNEWAEWNDENGRPEEVFVDLDPATLEVWFSLGAAGAAEDGDYRITINGSNFDYTALADTRLQVIANLIILINGGSEPVTAGPGTSSESLIVTATAAGVAFSFSASAPLGDTWVTTDLTPWCVVPGATLPVVFDGALFDLLTIPTPFETFFGWSPYGFLVDPPIEDASFGQLGTFEDFEAAWGLPLYFQFVPPNLLAGIDPEDFEAAWGQGAIPPFGANTSFANGTKTAEDFEDTSVITHVVTINTAAVGEYCATINGVSHCYTASGVDTTLSIAVALGAEILAGSVVADAVGIPLAPAFGIFPQNPEQDLLVTVRGPGSADIEVVLARNFPLLAEEWVGQDLTPDFD